MTENTKGPDAANEPATGAPPEPDFRSVPWQAMIGLRGFDDLEKANLVEIHCVITDMGLKPDGKGGEVPDNLQPAVHFTNWFERNKQAMVKLWEVEYFQYLNLHRMTAGRTAAKPPELRLVDPAGQRLEGGGDIITP